MDWLHAADDTVQQACSCTPQHAIKLAALAWHGKLANLQDCESKPQQIGSANCPVTELPGATAAHLPQLLHTEAVPGR